MVETNMRSNIFVGIMVGLMLLPACTKLPDQRPPIEIVKLVADKIIRETTFDFELIPQENVLGIQFVDFQKSLGNNGAGVGYALSYISSEKDTTTRLGLSSSDGVRIWINDQLLFQRTGHRLAKLTEIAYDRFVFQDTFQVKLQKGANKILVKAAASRDQWIFFLRAVTPTGEQNQAVRFSLEPVAPQITSTNWMCIGPFPNPSKNGQPQGMNIVYPPEKAQKNYYDFEKNIVGWTLPEQNALLELEIKPTNTFQRDSYLEWHYANGATLLGLLAVADATGEKRYVDFVRRACDFTLEHLDYFRWQYENLHAFRGSFHRIFRRTMLDDTGAPALPFLEMYLRENLPESRELLESIAEYIVHQQVRLEDGTFCRPEPVEYTVWADDLFMSVPFLLRMAKITSKQSYYDDAATQALRFAQRLFDSTTGLFYHGWFSPSNQTSVAFWGRANGWIIWAMSEALLHLPENHSQYHEILNIFQKHVEGLAKYQDAGGMWHQVLDHPESYEETSCTAMFVLGMARGVRLGWIDQKYRENALRGWAALTRKIDADGTVHDICKGTGIGNNLEFYFKRHKYDHDPRGLGAVLIAGVEVSMLQ